MQKGGLPLPYKGAVQSESTRRQSKGTQTHTAVHVEQPNPNGTLLGTEKKKGNPLTPTSNLDKGAPLRTWNTTPIAQ